MESIIDNLIKIAALAVCLGLGYLFKQLGALAKKRLSEKEQEHLEKFITELVSAAEQMFYGEDEDGSIRLNYVQQQLIEAGYDLTEAICAIIEAKVYELNQAKAVMAK